MASWGRALLFGLLVWLIPFLVSFAAFPLKESWRSLFESIMPVALALTVTPLAVLYLRRARTALLGEGALLGILWSGMSALIDLPLMLSPPLSYTLGEYLADVGLTYLMIPVITIGIALAAVPRSAN